MRNATRWINRHWWAYGTLVVVAEVAILLALDPGRSPARAIGLAVFYTALAFGIRAYLLRKDRRAAGDSRADVVRLNRMLRKGRTPEGETQREQMRGLVRRRDRQLRRLRWLYPLYNVVTLGIGVAALAAGGTGPGAMLVGMTLGLDILAFVGWRRQHRNIRRVGRAVGAF